MVEKKLIKIFGKGLIVYFIYYLIKLFWGFLNMNNDLEILKVSKFNLIINYIILSGFCVVFIINVYYLIKLNKKSLNIFNYLVLMYFLTEILINVILMMTISIQNGIEMFNSSKGLLILVATILYTLVFNFGNLLLVFSAFMFNERFKEGFE